MSNQTVDLDHEETCTVLSGLRCNCRLNTADTKPCIEDNEHRATQRHTSLECPAEVELQEAVARKYSSPLTKVTHLKARQRISLGTFGSVEVLRVHCIYPHEVARLTVMAASGLILLEVPAATMVEVQAEVSV